MAAEHELVGGDTARVVEAKVWASSVATLLLSGVVAILNAIQDEPSLLGFLPPQAQTVVLLVVPSLLTFAAGYVKRSNRALG